MNLRFGLDIFLWALIGASFPQVTFSGDISDLLWKNRVLIVSVKNTDVMTLETIDNFKSNNMCQLNDRKVRIITFIENTNPNYRAPSFMLNNTGMWLIGYDGEVKSYSTDNSLLFRILDLIDQMPIRKAELSKSPSVCPQ